VVEFAPLTIVRSEAAGFIEELRVEDGQNVEAGDLLVVLRNESLQAEAADLRLAIEQSQVQSRIHEQKGSIAACQAERSKADALAIRLREKEAEIALLEVRAPLGGTVIAHDLASKQGTFLRLGEEILSIGSEDQKEIRMAVSHAEYADFAKHLGRPAQVRLPGSQVLECVLAKIEPRASRALPHPAFSAEAGGPLAVRLQDDQAARLSEDAGIPGSQAPDVAELVEPRFRHS
jgi:putative peptide zinc metalloprotease protein